jgi:hypothetical protein
MKRLIEPCKGGYIHTHRWEKDQVLLGKPLPPSRVQKPPRDDDPLSSQEEEEKM